MSLFVIFYDSNKRAAILPHQLFSVRLNARGNIYKSPTRFLSGPAVDQTVFLPAANVTSKHAVNHLQNADETQWCIYYITLCNDVRQWMFQWTSLAVMLQWITTEPRQIWGISYRNANKTALCTGHLWNTFGNALVKLVQSTTSRGESITSWH